MQATTQECWKNITLETNALKNFTRVHFHHNKHTYLFLLSWGDNSAWNPIGITLSSIF